MGYKSTTALHFGSLEITHQREGQMKTTANDKTILDEVIANEVIDGDEYHVEDKSIGSFIKHTSKINGK